MDDKMVTGGKVEKNLYLVLDEGNRCYCLPINRLILDEEMSDWPEGQEILARFRCSRPGDVTTKEMTWVEADEINYGDGKLPMRLSGW